MAVLLMQQYGLLTLKVRFDPSKGQPLVLCEVEAGAGGSRETLQSWTCPPSEIGLPQRIDSRQTRYQGYTFHIPEYIVQGLRDLLHSDSFAGQPLWLHLAKPAGYLPLVPWEQLLQPALDVPMLRIPDFLSDPPTESPYKLEVALVSSVPEVVEQFPIVDHLYQIATKILQSVTRRTTVHIFTDRVVGEPLRQRLEGDGLIGSSIQVHDPAGAAAYAIPEATEQIVDPTGRIENPWLLWMLDALKGRSIDIVHCLTHGYFGRERGALALAESPLADGPQRIARFVGPAQLSLFLNRIGAWSVFFSSPEQNYSEMGLRLLADTVAQHRPGPVAHHEVRLDPSCDAVAAAYRFLCGLDHQSPPASPALFLYCHPSRLAPSLLTGLEGLAQATPQPKGLSVYSSAPELLIGNEDGPPTWVASAERYIEQRTREMEQMKQATTQPQSQEEIAELEKVLAQIRDIVADTAKSSTGVSAPPPGGSV